MSLYISEFFVLTPVTARDSRNCPHQRGGGKPLATLYPIRSYRCPSHSLTHITPFLYVLLTGHLPFHTIAKLSTVHRKRRDVEAEGSSNKLAFSLRLSNVTHSFEMSLSTDLLSPRYVLEEVSEDGRLVTVPSTVKDCYYIQDIRQSGLSAVTVCNHTVVSNVPSIICVSPTQSAYCVHCWVVSLVHYIKVSVNTYLHPCKVGCRCSPMCACLYTHVLVSANNSQCFIPVLI